MMLSGEAIADVVSQLKADDFYRSANGTIFKAILSIYAHGSPVDAITVVEELKRGGNLEQIGGHLYVHELVQNVATPASAAHYARIVGELALLRRMIAAAGRIMELGYSNPRDPERTADDAEDLIYKVARHSEQDEVVSMAALVDGAITELEKSQQHDSPFVGVPTGFTDLDSLTAGLHPGNLIVIAARPGVGKSSLVTNLARNVAVAAGTSVAMFSLEMSRWEIGMRLLCGEARVPWDNIRGKRTSPDDWARIVEAAEVLNEAPLFVVDSGNINIVDIRAKARRLRSKPGLGMIIVDYLQLMSSPGRVESRQQEIAEISRNLKLLAKEMEIPVIAVSQLNRDPERRQDKRPQLSDLRECVTGDTLVCLADGSRVPIRGLVGSTPEVLAVSAEGRLVVAGSDRVWSKGNKPVFAVQTATGRMMRVTARHRVLTERGWTRVHDLEVGDRLALARKMPEPANPLQWPDDHVMLLAHLIAAADLSGHPVAYGTRFEENARAVTAAARQSFDITPEWIEGERHAVSFDGTDHPNAFDDWLNGLSLAGRRRPELRVPGDVFRLADAQIARFLRHLWADAGAIAPGVVGGGMADMWFSATGRGLAEDVAALLLRVGVVAQLHDASTGAADRYEVAVVGVDEQARFLERVGAFGPLVPSAEQLALVLTSMADVTISSLPREVFDGNGNGAHGISSRMTAALRGTTSGGGDAGSTGEARPWHPSRTGKAGTGGGATGVDPDAAADESPVPTAGGRDLLWDPVVSVVIDGEEEVFDLTVPGPASWLADGVVSHNSGAIEQDADIVMFIHREDSEDPQVKGTADLIIAKHRNGPTGVVKLTFLPQLTQFKNYAPPQAVGNYPPQSQPTGP